MAQVARVARVLEVTPRSGGGWVFLRLVLNVEGREAEASGLVRIIDGNPFLEPMKDLK